VHVQSRFVGVVGAIVLSFFSTGLASEARDDYALLVLKSDCFEDTEETVASLEVAGGRALHVIPPKAIIALVPVEAEAGVVAIPNIAALHRTQVAAINGAQDAELAGGVSAWNHLLAPKPQAAEKVGSPLIGDTLGAPPSPEIAVEGASAAPTLNQTSEFMIGKIAVGVILPESNDVMENWDSTRQTIVFNEIVEGLDWWVTKGGTSAHLTFYYDQRFSVPTQYEPITQIGEADEDLWVSDIFQSMGYMTGNSYDRARAYVNHLRGVFHTDWCYAFIVVDSLNDSDGKFADGKYFAWAHLAGPYVIMTYDNDGWGIDQMHRVASHETGHIFLAGDEYCDPDYACCDFGNYGYLNIYNGNCEDGNPSSVPCIMRDNEDVICEYTLGQIGWKDTDSDGKPDAVDNVVTNTLNPHQTPTNEACLTLTGLATDVPCDSPTRTEVTINKISGVKFRVDSGLWRDAVAVDGAFDEDVEDYTFTTDALSAGVHQIETQAYSTSGNASAIASQYVEIQASTTMAWEWQNPLPTGNPLYAVWGSGPNDIFAAGCIGTIVHYDGSRWSTMTSGTTYNINGIWGSGPNDIFAVHDSGGILHYDGSNWSRMISGTSQSLSGVWGSGPNDVFAVGYNGTIRHYNGSSWSPMPSGTTQALSAVWGTAPGDVFAGGSSGTILHFNGSTWSSMTSGTTRQVSGIWGSSPDNIFAVSYLRNYGGEVLRYNGTSWSIVTSGTEYYAVWGSGSDDVFVVGYSGTVLHYDGWTWASMTSGTGINLKAIWGSGSTDVFAIGGGTFGYGSGPAVIQHYDGWAWSPMVTGSTKDLMSVWGSSAQDVFAVGDVGTILHYAGVSWSAMPSGTSACLYDVWGSGSNDVFAVGNSGTILHYNGSIWSAMVSGTTDQLHGVWGSAGNNVYAVGGSGLILHYNGSVWSQMPSGTSYGILDVWGSGPNDVFAVVAYYYLASHYGQILHYDGSAWSVRDGTGYLIDVCGNAPNDVFAVGYAGLVQHYDGGNWLQMNSGTSALLNSVWCGGPRNIFVAGGSEPSLGQGVLIHYDGVAWSSLAVPSYFNLRGVWGSTANDVFAVGLSGTIVHYGVHDSYSLALTVIGPDYGQVGIEPNLPLYPKNTTVALRAMPNEGKTFGGWSGDVPTGHEYDNPLILSMDSDKEVTATFKCGLGMAPMLPLMAVGLAGLVAIRRRR